MGDGWTQLRRFARTFVDAEITQAQTPGAIPGRLETAQPVCAGVGVP